MDEVLGGKAKRFGNKFKSFYAPQGFAVVNIYDDKQMKLNNNEREVEVHKSITEINHPNILSCFGRVQHSSTFYIFEELSRGGGLDVAATRGISEIRVVELFRQALDALTHLHEQSTLNKTQK